MPAYHILLNTTIISTTWTFYVPCNLWFCPLSCMAWGQESIWLGMRKNLLNPRTRRRVNKENILDPSTTFTTPNPCMCINCIYIPCNIDENVVCLLTSRVIEMYFLFLYQDIYVYISQSAHQDYCISFLRILHVKVFLVVIWDLKLVDGKYTAHAFMNVAPSCREHVVLHID